jgi:hypothetical protein
VFVAQTLLLSGAGLRRIRQRDPDTLGLPQLFDQRIKGALIFND